MAHHSIIRWASCAIALWASAAVAAQAPEAAGSATPAPADPYPLNAAGWGPEVASGTFQSRWVEDWSGMRQAGNAPALKATPLGADSLLTVSTELRVRADANQNAQLVRGDDYSQLLVRGVIGANLQILPAFRLYAELATGQVSGDGRPMAPNFANDAALQQLFVEARHNTGAHLFGVMIGRQEYADGPRQLISLSDGPNLHRTWNGVRAYVHGRRYRFGIFDFDATALNSGYFDERVRSSERLSGATASLLLNKGQGPNSYLEPFWIHSENPAYRVADVIGVDARDTYGLRLWGRNSNWRYDWTLARQTGRFQDRSVSAWGVFAVNSVGLSDDGWQPRLMVRLDVATGGNAFGSGQIKGFNSLYASSSYLGEGRFLALNNLVLLAPGLTVSPSRATTISIEYGFARRFTESDAAYGVRAYQGTQKVAGYDIGRLLRVSGNWSMSQNITFNLNLEHLAAGKILKASTLPGGTFGSFAATYRY